jgi:hypothetical protein
MSRHISLTRDLQPETYTVVWSGKQPLTENWSQRRSTFCDEAPYVSDKRDGFWTDESLRNRAYYRNLTEAKRRARYAKQHLIRQAKRAMAGPQCT